jgi:hypothetical protein
MRWRAIFDPAARRGRRRVRPADDRRFAVREEALGFFLDLDFFLAAIAFFYTSMTTGTITGLRFVVSMKKRRSVVRMWSRKTVGSVTPCTADSFKVTRMR